MIVGAHSDIPPMSFARKMVVDMMTATGPMRDVILMEDAVKLDIPEHDNPSGHHLRENEVENAWEGHGRQIAGVQLLMCRNCNNIVGVWTTKYGGRGGVATMLCFDSYDTYLSSDQSPQNFDYNVVPLTIENVSEAARYYFNLASPPPDANEQTEIEAAHREVHHEVPTPRVVRNLLMGLRPARRARRRTRRPRESRTYAGRQAETIDLTLSDDE
ncbi:hypothetical protein KEM56_007710 [Ascosphaera pollenicola]|nr:hypothetical protein KEM56_007710 [Ascosphaera pollenicola]